MGWPTKKPGPIAEKMERVPDRSLYMILIEIRHSAITNAFDKFPLDAVVSVSCE